jgi:gas vesicle protein
MKTQFYVGMGLGIAAASAAAMMMKPKQKDVKKALDAARQTLDRAMRKIGG